MIKIEFLWFDDCPNHSDARRLLLDVMAARQVQQEVDDVDATGPDVAQRYKFPGSPTIRINGADIEPGFSDPGDYTPRCRLYATTAGLKGIPERRWIEDAIDRAAKGDTSAGITKE